MVKKILSILCVLLLAGYLVFSAMAMTDRHEDVRMCKGVDLHITDSLDIELIDENMILSLLQEQSVDPVGLPLDGIDLERIEQTLRLHPLVGNVECYKTGGDMLRINISSKVPLVRVMNNRGQDFYVDSKGEILSQHSLAVQLPLATGYIDRKFASDQLLKVVAAIDRSEFWKAQVEQINVTREGQIELVPRVGDHLLILGTPDNIEGKLDRLMNFYENGLDNVGWNKYRSISVAYDNQVVCKKRK
ncbi:MAG: cell division protein FtsQ/DivIB [Bacteroidaceae bacterium]|nr:cell division protein FtsQ/DivIB [Bacteroidaceae bacterium]